MTTTYTDIPHRRWRRIPTTVDGEELVTTKTYRTVMAIVGRAMKDGAAIDLDHRLAPPEQHPVYDTVTVSITWPADTPAEPARETAPMLEPAE